ncbi:TonB-dependent receptor [Novosphingobium sp. 18052]|uniref:TonB-dependent receptor n=2 Tax=unclassified Novosphingobium TaxID=2644732 RepID=UPI0013590F92|nr:TonB-dependent receptor [Novosphingobium sp. 18052]
MHNTIPSETRLKLLSGAASVLAMVAMTPAIAAEGTSDVSATDAAGEISEITVTARYRTESAQEVPIAISSISSRQLDAQGASSLKQVVQQIPSLNIQGFSGRNQTITIRGIGTNAGGTNDGLEQGVGLYVDGVYRPRTGSVITDLIDIENIQVLRGPQGTLFGKNTVGGAIDITTREPQFEQEARAELGYGNYNQVRGYFSYNGVVSDALAFRVSYLRSRRDGLIYNTTQRQHWDNLDNHAARFDLLYKPSEDSKLRLIADYSIQRGDVGFTSVAGVLPTTLANGTQVRGFYRRAADVGYVPGTVNAFDRKTDIDSSQYDEMPSWGLQARADWDVGPLTLTSITAYRNWKWVPNYDGDQFGANIITNSVVATKQQQFSQELRATSKGGQTIDYTAGLYFFWQEADDDVVNLYGRDAAAWLTTPNNPIAATSTLPSSVFDGLVAYSHVLPATYSYAAYGQATWNISPSLRLTGGLRYTYEHKTGIYDAYATGDYAPLSSFAPSIQSTVAALRAAYAPSGSYTASDNTNNISGTAIAAYDLSPDVHTYASYSRGYKSPGINLVRQSLGVDIFVKPEKVDNYELGIKTRLLGGKTELNLALFWADVSNYQANFVNYAVTPVVGYISNVGKLRSRGVEVDARAQPVEGLSLGIAGTYNDAEYLSYRNAPSQFLYSYLSSMDLSGRRASGAPRLSLTGNAEYVRPVGTVDAFAGGDVSYRSGFYAAVNLDPFSWVDSYTLVGLHGGVRDLDDRWEASLWVRNLFNKNYFNTLSVSASNGIVQGALGEPRMYGLTIKGRL